MAQQTYGEWMRSNPPISTLTAVEWLFDQIPLEWTIKGSAKKIFEQAKQMEKEQIIHAWREGDNDSMYSPKELDKQAEQYYNETYERKS